MWWRHACARYANELMLFSLCKWGRATRPQEDLAEWLLRLYPQLDIDVDNFMQRLEDGTALCKVLHYRVFT